jgi:hypothetical protein
MSPIVSACSSTPSEVPVNVIDNNVVVHVAVLIDKLGGPGEPMLGGEVATVGCCQNLDLVLTFWLFRGLFSP